MNESASRRGTSNLKQESVLPNLTHSPMVKPETGPRLNSLSNRLDQIGPFKTSFLPMAKPETGPLRAASFPEVKPETGPLRAASFPEVKPETGPLRAASFPEVKPETGPLRVSALPEVKPETGPRYTHSLVFSAHRDLPDYASPFASEPDPMPL